MDNLILFPNFKKLYHNIVKTLHPDLHLDLAQTHLDLFGNAVVAYKNGELETMNSELISIFHGKGGNLTITKPFEHEIYSFGTCVAGTSHVTGIKELEPQLKSEDLQE